MSFHFLEVLSLLPWHFVQVLAAQAWLVTQVPRMRVDWCNTNAAAMLLEWISASITVLLLRYERQNHISLEGSPYCPPGGRRSNRNIPTRQERQRVRGRNFYPVSLRTGWNRFIASILFFRLLVLFREGFLKEFTSVKFKVNFVFLTGEIAASDPR